MKNRVSPPPRRRLKIFAFDPTEGRKRENQVVIDVPFERVEPGPVTERIAVVDYDVTADRYYDAVDLNDPSLLMNDGLDPNESDPRFHQQMVYAVARRVLGNFDVTLGRRIAFRGGYPLRIFPHAMSMANAFYDPRLGALVFGYFSADDSSDAFVPGQNIFTCLSHDVIAHEMTHALLHRLKPRYLNATNPDVAAFHEGFSDLVAIFQHFSFPDILRETIRGTGNLLEPAPLMQLAREFGLATGRPRALRSAWSPAVRTDYARLFNAHDRGSILVAAVFDAFFAVYQGNVRDLMRLVRNETGELPDPLVTLLAKEAARVAQAVLTMCIRGIEYLPPVDVTFGDYVRALVTADYDINPVDELGLRAAVIESFRARGILPAQSTSLAEDAVRFNHGDLPDIDFADKESEIFATIRNLTVRHDRVIRLPTAPAADGSSPTTWRFDDELSTELETRCSTYARKYLSALGLKGDVPFRVVALHPTTRYTAERELLVDVVAELVQDTSAAAAPVGVTIIASAAGVVRYAVVKPSDSDDVSDELRSTGTARQAQFREFLEADERVDNSVPYGGRPSPGPRIVDFRAMHRTRFQ